jgi:hypothetical protein
LELGRTNFCGQLPVIQCNGHHQGEQEVSVLNLLF